MVMAEYIYSRLDRAMGNQRWLSTFPESSVAVLPRLKFADPSAGSYLTLSFAKAETPQV